MPRAPCSRKEPGRRIHVENTSRCIVNARRHAGFHQLCLLLLALSRSDKCVLGFVALCRVDCAVLCCAMLCCALLCCAVLCCALSCCAALAVFPAGRSNENLRKPQKHCFPLCLHTIFGPDYYVPPSIDARQHARVLIDFWCTYIQ